MGSGGAAGAGRVARDPGRLVLPFWHTHTAAYLLHLGLRRRQLLLRAALVLCLLGHGALQLRHLLAAPLVPLRLGVELRRRRGRAGRQGAAWCVGAGPAQAANTWTMQRHAPQAPCATRPREQQPHPTRRTWPPRPCFSYSALRRRSLVASSAASSAARALACPSWRPTPSSSFSFFPIARSSCASSAWHLERVPVCTRWRRGVAVSSGRLRGAGHGSCSHRRCTRTQPISIPPPYPK